MNMSGLRKHLICRNTEALLAAHGLTVDIESQSVIGAPSKKKGEIDESDFSVLFLGPVGSHSGVLTTDPCFFNAIKEQVDLISLELFGVPETEISWITVYDIGNGEREYTVSPTPVMVRSGQTSTFGRIKGVIVNPDASFKDLSHFCKIGHYNRVLRKLSAVENNEVLQLTVRSSTSKSEYGVYRSHCAEAYDFDVEINDKVRSMINDVVMTANEKGEFFSFDVDKSIINADETPLAAYIINSIQNHLGFAPIFGNTNKNDDTTKADICIAVESIPPIKNIISEKKGEFLEHYLRHSKDVLGEDYNETALLKNIASSNMEGRYLAASRYAVVAAVFEYVNGVNIIPFEDQTDLVDFERKHKSYS